jgi:hypothetical protein
VEPGAKTSPVSLRPKQQDDDAQADARKKQEEFNLREKAKYLNIVQDDGGQMAIELVKTQLQKRIKALIAEDPEANSYKALLNEMGAKYRAAQGAVDELFARNFKE